MLCGAINRAHLPCLAHHAQCNWNIALAREHLTSLAHNALRNQQSTLTSLTHRAMYNWHLLPIMWGAELDIQVCINSVTWQQKFLTIWFWNNSKKEEKWRTYMVRHPWHFTSYITRTQKQRQSPFMCNQFVSKVDYWDDNKLTLFRMDLHIDFVEPLE
jgi:hypothetical protein